MYTVITEFTVPEERREAFEENFAASMNATLTDVQGLQRASLLRPDGADRGYLATLEFDDGAAYTAYTSSASFRHAHEKPRQTYAEGRQVTSYRTVAQIGG